MYSSRFWTLVGMTALVGMLAGFTLPLAASRHTAPFTRSGDLRVSQPAVVLIPTRALPPSQTDVPVIISRHRKPEALQAATHHRIETAGDKPED